PGMAPPVLHREPAGPESQPGQKGGVLTKVYRGLPFEQKAAVQGVGLALGLARGFARGLATVDPAALKKIEEELRDPKDAGMLILGIYVGEPQGAWKSLKANAGLLWDLAKFVAKYAQYATPPGMTEAIGRQVAEWVADPRGKAA